MDLIPYLSFNGQCEAAFKFYEIVLGARIEFVLTYGNSPMADQVPPEWHDKILHATLAVGNRILQGADNPPDRHEQVKGIALSLDMQDPAEAERIFQSLAENGTVQMALQETFWALRFGTLVDEFGIPWIVNCGKSG